MRALDQCVPEAPGVTLRRSDRPGVCVYCSSSSRVPAVYVECARDLGRRLAEAGHTLVYGGARVGLMGEIATAVRAAGGRVEGVIPRSLFEAGIGNDLVDEMIVTEDLHERKAVMAERSSGFVALPGGFGTLEELLEIITLKQLRAHRKPIVLINTGGFFDPLLEQFESMYREGFTKEAYRGLYRVAPDAAAALDYLGSYEPEDLGRKW